MATSTRDRLLDSALERFAADGLLGTTLDHVREGAGASVGAVYHHFPDKEALDTAARARALADYQAGYIAELERHGDAEEGIRAVVAFHFRWCGSNVAAAKLLLDGRPSTAEDLNRDFFPRIVAWWRPHAHYGVVRELDFPLIHALWLGPAMELTRHWLAGTGPKPTRKRAETIADAAWAALRNPTEEA